MFFFVTSVVGSTAACMETRMYVKYVCTHRHACMHVCSRYDPCRFSLHGMDELFLCNDEKNIFLCATNRCRWLSLAVAGGNVSSDFLRAGRSSRQSVSERERCCVRAGSSGLTTRERKDSFFREKPEPLLTSHPAGQAKPPPARRLSCRLVSNAIQGFSS